MATLHHTISAVHHHEHAHAEHTHAKNWLQRIEEKSEFNRYGIISMFFLLIGIAGGITIAVSAYAYIWQISAIAILTMMSLSLMLAVAPMKYIIRVTVAALFLDVLFLILNIFM